MKRRLRTAGLVMLAAAAALVIFWESGGGERFMYERIPVMASDVTRGRRQIGRASCRERV